MAVPSAVPIQMRQVPSASRCGDHNRKGAGEVAEKTKVMTELERLMFEMMFPVRLTFPDW
jgi:hypothetical protein